MGESDLRVVRIVLVTDPNVSGKRVFNAWEVIEHQMKLELHPLLTPASSRSEIHLVWDMRWPARHCQRSDEPESRSWVRGRAFPATYPRVTSLRMLCSGLRWQCTIVASNEEQGVTCEDVIEGLQFFMEVRVSQDELERASAGRQEILSHAYWDNRSTEPGSPGRLLPNTLLRFDWLGKKTKFGGLATIDAYTARESFGTNLPWGTVELLPLKRYSSRRNTEERGDRRHRARPRDREIRGEIEPDLPPPGVFVPSQGSAGARSSARGEANDRALGRDPRARSSTRHRRVAMPEPPMDPRLAASEGMRPSGPPPPLHRTPHPAAIGWIPSQPEEQSDSEALPIPQRHVSRHASERRRRAPPQEPVDFQVDDSEYAAQPPHLLRRSRRVPQHM